MIKFDFGATASEENLRVLDMVPTVTSVRVLFEAKVAHMFIELLEEYGIEGWDKFREAKEELEEKVKEELLQMRQEVDKVYDELEISKAASKSIN